MESPRWHLRLDSFGAALELLGEAVAMLSDKGLSVLEREGLVQRFEYTWELGWKVMRDYLREAGVSIAVDVPANVIRAAFAANLIEDGDAWMDARKARNVMAHEYDQAAFEQIVIAISQRYYPLLRALHLRLEQERGRAH